MNAIVQFPVELFLDHETPGSKITSTLLERDESESANQMRLGGELFNHHSAMLNVSRLLFTRNEKTLTEKNHEESVRV